MRSVLIVACALLSAVVDTSAQTRTADGASPAQQPVSLSACSPVDNAQTNRFVAAPPARVRFVPRSTGAVLLRVGHGVRFVGGLMHSANLAAQAGSIDPTVVAMAMATDAVPGRDRIPVRAPVVYQSPGQPIRVDCPPR
jgi:hypothetical protein